VEKHAQQEVNYRLSKWLIWNASIEQLLTPNEVENVFRELLSFYDPPTRCVEQIQSMFNRENSTLPFKFRTFLRSLREELRHENLARHAETGGGMHI